MPSSSLFLRSSTTLISITALFTSVLAVPAISPRQATTPNYPYTLAKEYSGSSFFNDFTFFGNADPTHGFVTYGNRRYAEDNNLIGFEGDYAVMSIDSTTNLGKGDNYYAQTGNRDYWLTNNVGRKSVRIEGNYEFTHGLIITDVGQMPSGICGTWPAFWTLGGQRSWPQDGEIDIIEGSNTQGGFWSALHAGSPSNINNNNDAYTGRITATDCDTRVDSANPNFVGCKFENDDRATWDNYNGGVWASQWTSDRIKIWFWPYGSVPADVAAGTPSPGSPGWGTPRSSFAPPQNLRVDQNFRNHHLVIDTTFCGDLADATWASSGCQRSTGFTSCADFVANRPQAFADAKWKIKYVKIFSEGPVVVPTSSSSSAVVSSTSSAHSSKSSVASSSSSLIASSSSSHHSSSETIASSSSVAPSSSKASSSTAVTTSHAPSSVGASVPPVSSSHVLPPFSSTKAGNYSLGHGYGPKTSSRGRYGSGDDEDDGGYEPKPTSSKAYGGGYHGDSSKPATTSTSSKADGGGHGGYDNVPKPTSSRAYGGGNGGYGDDDEDYVTSTSTIITTTKVPCATYPYYEVATTTYVSTVTVYIKPTPHVEHQDDHLVVPSKNGVAPPAPEYTTKVPTKAHVEEHPSKPELDVPESPYMPSSPAVPVKPAAPGGGYDAPASSVAPSSKPYTHADSWPLAGATPSDSRYYPTNAYDAKPATFTGGASSNALVSSGILAAVVGAVAALLS